MGDNKLHQLLAVEADLATQGRNILEETKNTFIKKEGLFDGLIKVYTALNEGDPDQPSEEKGVVTSVSEKLDYTFEAVIRAIDATISKEETNSRGSATASLEVDGVIFGTFAATTLLALEKYLLRIREVYSVIPTLDPARTWKKEDQSGRNLFVSSVETKFHTSKKQSPLVLYPATDKHPAQVQLITEDVRVGKSETTYYSGKITPGKKSVLLGRIDALLLAVKMAREEANSVKAIQINLGRDIFNYIHKEDK